MKLIENSSCDIPNKQKAIRAKCLHPSGRSSSLPLSVVEKNLIEIFEEQVRVNPNRLAVKTGKHNFTYAELNSAANRIAHAIIMHQREGEGKIALLLEHGAMQMVGMIGILKAGKVYVPLDPTYPHKRLEYMLEDSDSELLLTNHANRSLSAVLAKNMPIIDIDDLDEALPTNNPGLRRSPEDLALLLYTSGSTGTPKGYAQTHCNIVIDTLNYTNAGNFCIEDRFLLVSSLCFADSLRTIYGALLNGAGLYPFDIKSEGLMSLTAWLIQNEITIYRSVPTVFRQFANTLNGEERFPQIRLIYLSGEPVYKRDVELYREYFSDNCILVNRLGTGEALTFRMNFIEKETQIEGIHVPVGYEVPEKEVFLIGSVKQEEDGSRTGEIAVKSKFISPGYWKRPDLTEKTFLNDPEEGSKKIYLTGDLGRILPDGCLVHLGRNDFQVKIRGYRIDVAEIEMALLDHVAIKEAAVRIWEYHPGDERLVAYCVFTEQHSTNVTELRRFLSDILPVYMIPSAFVWLDALPLLPNGKLNRLGLPKPDQLRPDLENTYVSPSTDLEEKMADIWSEILGIDQIGIHDNFFELGGHSLLAARLFTHIEKMFQRNLPLTTLLHAPTIAQLVDNLADKGWSPPWSSLVPIQPTGTNLPFFFVHAHGGNVVGYYELARHIGADRPFYGLQARGLNSEHVAVRNIEEMASYYIDEIQSVQKHGPYLIGGWCFGGTVAYEMAQQFQARQEPVALLVMVQSQHPSYPSFMPSVTKVHRMIYRLVGRIDLEMSNMLEVSSNKRLQHLSGRAKRVLTILQVRIEGLTTSCFARFGIKGNNSRAYASHLLGEAHREALKSYTPQPYQGRSLLFRSAKQPIGIYSDPSLGWQLSIGDQLESIEIPGHRLGMLSEPRVRIIAEALQDRFNQLE